MANGRNSKRYYIDGNTVREIDVERERKERQQRIQKEEERRKRNRRNAAKRNRERALHMSRAYVAFLSTCVMISAFAAGYYVKIQSQVTTRMRSVAVLQSQVTDLKTDNDAMSKRIDTSINLDYIKDVAMNQLGMTYASQDQIIYYTVDNTNYMNQYSDIPEK